MRGLCPGDGNTRKGFQKLTFLLEEISGWKVTEENMKYFLTFVLGGLLMWAMDARYRFNSVDPSTISRESAAQKQVFVKTALSSSLFLIEQSRTSSAVPDLPSIVPGHRNLKDHPRIY
jgi:hypothetical protein